MKQNISIVIVYWNTPDLLEKQLQHLSQTDLDITVVDNASEKSLNSIIEKYPQIKLIQNKKNRGFAFACNQGALEINNEWLLFLNPDVEVTSSQIEEMMVKAEKNRFDATSPTPASQNYAKPIPSVLSLLAEFTSLKYFTPLSFFKQKTLTGGCLLIKTEIFKKLGGFDERFFLWFEDSDLTKILIDGGYKIGWVDIDIKHLGGASFKYHDGQIHRDIFFHSMGIYAKKHFSKFGQIIVSVIKKRYTSRHLLPIINEGVNITIPNAENQLIENFLKGNNEFFSANDEYIIVTSAISQSEIWQWREKYPNIRFIPIEKNNGFAQTVNIGLCVSTTEWLGTVNDDVVLNKEWIKNCLECGSPDSGSEELLYGSINPLIYKQDGSLESAGVDILPYGKALPKTSYDKNQDCFETDVTNAAAVLYRNQALNRTDLFDEKFGSYLEDIDLSLRLKRIGYKNIVNTKASIVHLGQQTSKNFEKYKNWLDFKNWILVILKNWRFSKFVFNLPSIIVERLRNISGIIKSF